MRNKFLASVVIALADILTSQYAGAQNKKPAPPVPRAADGHPGTAILWTPHGRTVVLPYRSDVPLENLWPKGLKSETDVPANPGAKVINEADAFPASAPSAYLFWKRATQSNLYRIPIPN